MILIIAKAMILIIATETIAAIFVTFTHFHLLMPQIRTLLK